MLALVGSFAITCAIGLPILNSVNLVRWKRHTSGKQKLLTAAYRPPGFTPVDFGEPKMKWPSQITRDQRHRTPEMPWPSETWDEPFAPRKPSSSPATSDSRPDSVAKAKASGIVRGAQARTKATRPKAKVPSQEEVVEMVQSLGFAAAVDEIRRRTGWDFKKAAHYLAQAIR